MPHEAFVIDLSEPSRLGFRAVNRPNQSTFQSLCLSLICLGGSHLHGAIQITGFSSVTNDRFANDPSFVLNDQDLSGVAIAEDGRWLTMLSSNVFITADHYASPNDTSVTFYGTNDPLGSSFTTTVQSSMQIGSTDIRLGVLTDALPTDYAAYDILNYPIPPNTNAIPVLMFGRSETAFPQSQDMAIGQNIMDQFYTDVLVSGNVGDTGVTTFDSPGVPYEAQLATFDSGAPVMVIDGGELTIVGVNWFTGTDGASNEISGFSYLPNYATEIEAYIAENALSPVPEPALTSLVFGLVALGLATRRNHSASV